MAKALSHQASPTQQSIRTLKFHTPPESLNHLATSCHIQHPGNIHCQAWEMLMKKIPNNKTSVSFRKNKAAKFVFQMIVLFISGVIFRFVAFGWLDGGFNHFHDLAEPKHTKSKTKLETFILFFSFFSGSNLRSKYVKVTYC